MALTVHSPEQIGLPFPGACVSCGTAHNRSVGHPLYDGIAEGTPVTWVCCVCEGLVCMDCAVRKAASPMGPDREIYAATYCSARCREANRSATRLGKPFYLDDELDEPATYERPVTTQALVPPH